MVADFIPPIRDGISDLEIQTRREVEGQILSAGLKQTYDNAYGKFELAAYARSMGIPIETVEQIAQELAYRQMKIDLEESEFVGMVSQVRKIEALPDAGFREWKLSKLSRRYKLSRSEMMNAYNKALIHQSALTPMSLSQLKEAFGQSVQWTVHGWFPAGVTMLIHGHGGTAKTLFLYEVAAAIAKGQPWNGYPVSQGEVLILQADEPPHITHERLETLEITDDDPLRVFPGWQVEAMPQLEAYLSKNPVKFILVDSNTSTNRNTLISENDVEYARPMLQLSDLASRHGCTICVIHHSNANGDARGTKALHNSVSEVWALSVSNEATGERLIRIQKNRVGRAPGRYRFDFDPTANSFTYQGEAGDENSDAASTEKKIELWLNEDEHRGVPYEAEELAHELKININTVRKLLYELWAKGIVQREKKGKKFLYHVGNLPQEYPTDRKILTDRLNSPTERWGRSVGDPCVSNGFEPTDQLIDENGDFSLMRNAKNADQLISWDEKQTEQESTTDRSTDRLKKPTDQLALIDNADHLDDHLVQVGDVVIPNTSATWSRRGSTRIDSKELPPSKKSALVIPINEMGSVMFDELRQPSRVVAILGDDDRVKVRNQVTGRDSVFEINDVQIYAKADRQMK
ncbi:hypothetical protein C7B65_22745 [Phormidesmis priestleyi ULC007]|uniref:AAA family ATPase n=1 Tax=Phormidesmis priestleyi ULC007 TaxID=1920490 RepID=A0A2T1D6H3_9CYAN|nr:AAA family ATPase [Phormidesmis priestleyi]PSB16046.1 hypothetical protein C7B65_22745 [Phormidesmis priestleyi ULC007]PZO52242.1 MAG: hypothetical protein DCF14_07195 [Phormidesmis priestleyi]